MLFLVDAQLPPSLARWIASQGQKAEHVALVLTPMEQDTAILKLFFLVRFVKLQLEVFR
jgi:predicted nuclease of predicted toxin-antitoxin system